MSSSKGLISPLQLCRDIGYLPPNFSQLIETRHPDANVDLPLAAPEGESKGDQGQIMTTREEETTASLQVRRQT